jgi:hypothetical protein
MGRAGRCQAAHQPCPSAWKSLGAGELSAPFDHREWSTGPRRLSALIALGGKGFGHSGDEIPQAEMHPSSKAQLGYNFPAALPLEPVRTSFRQELYIISAKHRPTA